MKQGHVWQNYDEPTGARRSKKPDVDDGATPRAVNMHMRIPPLPASSNGLAPFPRRPHLPRLTGSVSHQQSATYARLEGVIFYA